MGLWIMLMHYRVRKRYETATIANTKGTHPPYLLARRCLNQFQVLRYRAISIFEKRSVGKKKFSPPGLGFPRNALFIKLPFQLYITMFLCFYLSMDLLFDCAAYLILKTHHEHL